MKQKVFRIDKGLMDILYIGDFVPGIEGTKDFGCFEIGNGHYCDRVIVNLKTAEVIGWQTYGGSVMDGWPLVEECEPWMSAQTWEYVQSKPKWDYLAGCLEAFVPIHASRSAK